MKRFILGAAVFGLLLGPVAQANAMLITFEGLGNETNAVTTIGIANFTNAILAEVGSPIVAYFTDENRSGDTISGPAGTDFGSFFITDPIISGDLLTVSPITVTFDVPVTDVSFYVLDLDGAQVPNDSQFIETVTAQIFDSSATLVDSLTFTDTVPGTGDGTGDAFGTLYQFNNATPITTLALDLSRPDGFGGWGVDNLAFSPYTTPTPEPGTLLLLGTGFIGMGTMVRRQSKRNRK